MLSSISSSMFLSDRRKCSWDVILPVFFSLTSLYSIISVHLKPRRAICIFRRLLRSLHTRGQKLFTLVTAFCQKMPRLLMPALPLALFLSGQRQRRSALWAKRQLLGALHRRRVFPLCQVR